MNDLIPLPCGHSPQALGTRVATVDLPWIDAPLGLPLVSCTYCTPQVHPTKLKRHAARVRIWHPLCPRCSSPHTCDMTWVHSRPIAGHVKARLGETRRSPFGFAWQLRLELIWRPLNRTRCPRDAQVLHVATTPSPRPLPCLLLAKACAAPTSLSR